MQINDIKEKTWSFPAGERGLTIENPEVLEAKGTLTYCLDFKGSDSVFDLLLSVNAIRHVNPSIPLDLLVPYFPYSRQDRVAAPGETFALQVMVDVLKTAKFRNITTWDAHSDVLAGMFDAGVFYSVPQHSLVQTLVRAKMDNEGGTALIAPDAGALKKIYPLAKKFNLPVIEAKKIRNIHTGKIEKTEIDFEAVSKYNSLIVVDDICDGGATFIELGKKIREVHEGELHLVTTHGIYSKGLEVLYEVFDSVQCVNNMYERNNNV